MVHRDRLSEAAERARLAKARRRRWGLVFILLGLAWGLALWQTGLGDWLMTLGGAYLDAAGKALFILLLVIGLALRGRGGRPGDRD